jgi:hypothetical protein
MIGKSAINEPKNAARAWQLSHNIKRPSPPDLFCQIHDGISAAVSLVAGCNYAHFSQQLIWWQPEKFGNAWILQGRHSKTALGKGVVEPASECCADIAIPVDKNPSAGRPTAFSVSHF